MQWLVLVLITVLALLFVLQREPSHDGKSVTYWLNELKQDATLQYLQRAQTAFRKMGVRAVPIMLSKVRRYRSVSARGYRKLWPSLPAWLQSKLPMPLGDQEFDALTRAITTALPLAGEGSVPLLIKASKEKDREVRLAAVTALGSFADQSSTAAEALVTALDDADAWIRVMATMGVRRNSSVRRAALPQLIQALKGDDRCIGGGLASGRHCAAQLLGQMGADAQTEVPALMELMDAKPWVESAEMVEQAQVEAAISLWRITSTLEPSLSVLTRHLENTEWAWVRRSILEVLAEIGPPATSAAPAIHQAMKNMVAGNGQNSDERLGNKNTAQRALDRITPTASPPALSQ